MPERAIPRGYGQCTVTHFQDPSDSGILMGSVSGASRVSDPLLYVVAGAAVGALVGLTGVGGGSLMTPILVLAFGQSPSVAVGTDLLFASPTKIVASGSFGLSRRILWPIVGRLALGSIPGAAAVLAILSVSARRDLHADRVVMLSLGLLLILTAAGMLVERMVSGRQTHPEPGAHPPPRRLVATVTVGLLVGAAVTLTSVGAGALGTVALLYLFPWLSTDRIVGTDIAHAVPLTLVAGLGHAALGHTDLHVLGLLLLGSVPSVLIASRLALRIAHRWLRVLLAVMLAVVGGKILYGA